MCRTHRMRSPLAHQSDLFFNYVSEFCFDFTWISPSGRCRVMSCPKIAKFTIIIIVWLEILLVFKKSQHAFLFPHIILVPGRWRSFTVCHKSSPYACRRCVRLCALCYSVLCADCVQSRNEIYGYPEDVTALRLSSRKFVFFLLFNPNETSNPSASIRIWPLIMQAICGHHNTRAYL